MPQFYLDTYGAYPFSDLDSPCNQRWGIAVNSLDYRWAGFVGCKSVLWAKSCWIVRERNRCKYVSYIVHWSEGLRRLKLFYHKSQYWHDSRGLLWYQLQGQHLAKARLYTIPIDNQQLVIQNRALRRVCAKRARLVILWKFSNSRWIHTHRLERNYISPQFHPGAMQLLYWVHHNWPSWRWARLHIQGRGWKNRSHVRLHHRFVNSWKLLACIQSCFGQGWTIRS